MAALTTRALHDRSGVPLLDFLKRLDRGYPVTLVQLFTLYEAVYRNDYSRADEVHAVKGSQALDKHFSSPAEFGTLQELLKELSVLVIANKKPDNNAQLVLYHAVMGHSLAECAQGLLRAEKSNLFIQQVALSVCGVKYSQIKDHAIKIWCEELDAALLTEMVKSVPDMPEDLAARAQYAHRLNAAYAGGSTALTKTPLVSAALAGLASKHRSTLRDLLANSPLSKVWTKERIETFNQRLSNNDDSSTPSEKQRSSQLQNQHIEKIKLLAPVARAVLKTRASKKEYKDALSVTTATFKVLLNPSA